MNIRKTYESALGESVKRASVIKMQEKTKERLEAIPINGGGYTGDVDQLLNGREFRTEIFGSYATMD